MADIQEIETILARWDSGEGKPYKGSLIDWNDYGGDGSEPPANIGCMCAQGQMLHLLGGWEPRRLHDTCQDIADGETAKLLNISRAHAILLRNINDKVDGAPSVVLTDPGKILGDQWSKLLDFWWAFDQFDSARWRGITAAWVAARDAAGVAARAAAGVAAGVAARAAARDAAGEIQGFSVLSERGRAAFFLPIFGWDTPADIPTRPRDYGLGVVPGEPA